jgi:hypothetical protein
MGNVKALINNSVADVKSAMECVLMTNPAQAMSDAIQAIEYINLQFMGEDHQKSRLAMLRTIVNKARRQLGQ